MIGIVWKKTHKKEMRELSMATIDLYGRTMNFVKLVMELLRLFEQKQLSRRKFAKELFATCNEFMAKLGGDHGRKKNSK